MNRIKAYGGVTLAVLIWGLSFQVGENLASHISPWELTVWRYTLAAGIMTIVAYASLGKRAWVPRGNLPQVALMGLFGHALFSLCFFYGLQSTPASTAAVITGLEPAIAAGLASLFMGRQAGGRTWLGIGIALAGVAMASTAGQHGQQAAVTWTGPLLVFASAMCFAIYSLMGEAMMRQIPPFAMSAATMRWSLPPLWLGTIWNDGGAKLWLLSVSDVSGLAFFVLGVTMIAFLGWNSSLKALGVERTMVWANGVPVVGVLAAALLGHGVQSVQWWGLALVVAGVLMVQKRNQAAHLRTESADSN